MHFVKKRNRLFQNRLLWVAAAVSLQFFWLFLLLYHFSMQFGCAGFLLRLLALFFVLSLAGNSMNPCYKLAWSVILLLVPVFGICLYLVFGREKLTKKIRCRMEKTHERITAQLPCDAAIRAGLERKDPRAAGLSSYISQWAKFPLYCSEGMKYYCCGEEMFTDMLYEMEHAGKFIFLEYFIIEEGEMLETILAVLEKKVKQGVEVRLIYDDMGCIRNFPARLKKRLADMGIACAVFNPLRPVLSVLLNNRDHRKILVVDGTAGFTGGLNIADEYINRKKRLGYWKDTGIRIRGEAVKSLTAMFLEMWADIHGTQESCGPYLSECAETELPERTEAEIPVTGGFVQPYADIPFTRENISENVYLNMIQDAVHTVYIYTPYLIIDHEMMVALQNTAKRGVDVRIITPGKPDKKLIFFLTRSYYPQLLQSGVKIYQYTPGFLHGKCVVCDDRMAAVGTVNFDYRSLYLHFECGIFLSDTEIVRQVKEDVLCTVTSSEQISKDFCAAKIFPAQLLLGVLRLFAPLL